MAGFIFDPAGRTAPTYEQLQQRRKIAAIMMARQSPRPKTFGEGLAAIGEAYGDRAYSDWVDQQDKASKDYEAASTTGAPEPTTPKIVPYDPEQTTTAPPPSMPPPPPPAAAVPPRPPLQSRSVPVPNTDAVANNPLPADQQQDPDSPIIRMPSAQAVQDWRNSVQMPTFPQPKPQPGPRSEAEPSPLGAANIPPMAASPQPPPGVQTAALSPTGTMTDAPDPAANAVRDNIARAAMPQPTQLAQNVFPPVASDASKAVMPGGFQPPGPPQPPPAPPAPAIRAAPPAATIQAAPPEVRPLSKPTPPQLQPMVNDRVRYYDAQTRNPYLSDTARAAAQEQIKQEQLQIKAANDQLTSQYNDYQKRYLDQQDPKNVYSTEKERRGLIPEGFFALTPEERARVPVVPGVDFYKDRWGNLKEVKSPISVQQTVDTAGEKQESKTGGELAAKRQGEMIEAANKAGENLTTIARAEELLKRIDTNAFAPGNTTLSAMGRAVGVSDDFMRGLGLKPEQIGSRQAFVAIVNELTMGKIGPGGMPANNFSEGDRKFLTQTQISLGDDPESNRIKLAAARTLAELHIERADKWGDWKEANPGKSYADFERIWNKELKSRNAFGELNRQARELLDRQKDGGQPAVPQPQTPAALPYTEKDRADAIKWIGDNQGSPKIPAIKQRYGLP